MEYLFFAFLKGLSLGLIIAIPSIGQALLCIKETLSRGILYGLISGLGVAVADTVFALLAGFGVESVRSWIASYQSIMSISGAVVVLLFGVLFLLKEPDVSTDSTELSSSHRKVFHAFMPNFLLTALHPITLIFFGAAFAALPVDQSISATASISLIGCGVFMGSMFWWLALSWNIVYFSKDRLTPQRLLKIKKVFGIIMILLGCWLFIKHTVP